MDQSATRTSTSSGIQTFGIPIFGIPSLKDFLGMQWIFNYKVLIYLFFSFLTFGYAWFFLLETSLFKEENSVFYTVFGVLIGVHILVLALCVLIAYKGDQLNECIQKHVGECSWFFNDFLDCMNHYKQLECYHKIKFFLKFVLEAGFSVLVALIYRTIDFVLCLGYAERNDKKDKIYIILSSALALFAFALKSVTEYREDRKDRNPQEAGDENAIEMQVQRVEC